MNRRSVVATKIARDIHYPPIAPSLEPSTRPLSTVASQMDATTLDRTTKRPPCTYVTARPGAAASLRACSSDAGEKSARS